MRSYAALLSVLVRLIEPAERSLADVGGWADLVPAIDISACTRARFLHQDLAALDVPASGPPAILPALDCVDDALGRLYVLEGSSLGGRVIARRVHRLLGDDVPVAFFAGHLRDSGADWQSLKRTLDARPPSSNQRIITAALDMFAVFADWLEHQGDLEKVGV